MASETDSQYFSDRDWDFWRAAMDHIEHSVGNEWAFQGDVAYNFDDGSFLRRIKFGARYADRDQTIRYTTYNWGALSEVWSGTAGLHGPGRHRTDLVRQLPELLPRPDRRARRAAIIIMAT